MLGQETWRGLEELESDHIPLRGREEWESGGSPWVLSQSLYVEHEKEGPHVP